jgi:hypothetical protein
MIPKRAAGRKGSTYFGTYWNAPDWRRSRRRFSLNRTYVILVLPKCLLTWGYVKVDVAAFCLQHDDRHGESAGRWRFDFLNTYIRNEPGETFCLHPDGL